MSDQKIPVKRTKSPSSGTWAGLTFVVILISPLLVWAWRWALGLL